LDDKKRSDLTCGTSGFSFKEENLAAWQDVITEGCLEDLYLINTLKGGGEEVIALKIFP
jgi:hypothetical protein